jgi:hypothetical protein
VKQKYTDLTARILLSVFGVILVGITIYYTKNFYHTTSTAAKNMIKGTEEFAEVYTDYDINQYDGEEVRGSEVINLIKKNLGDYTSPETAPLYVYVETVISGVRYKNKYLDNAHLNDIKNFSKPDFYIRPTAFFDCKVVKSKNKAILGINFIQK